ncbi:MAG: flagellar biosynthesis anti-sigma factor FlgM [SAR86 cluster bacterium]|uniref:Negative regulator of flagellin synthesis n=1 Tax=SAR86 cluster bacterium TaxID=2030880 RepID=A0A2A4XHZ3_9GAMM|nr:MAG: flagellar biosynthesis anti-sigma factor FlgM [SAR86 cluster bacterium]
MSTEIQTGKIPANVISPSASNTLDNGHKAKSSTTAQASPSGIIDTVSMTDQAARLKELESTLAAYPDVDASRVAEMKQAIADGTLEMNFEDTAADLIEIESARSNSAVE